MGEAEKCDKCGELGYDRRTLWMACLYSMEEMELPFKQCAIKGVYCKKIGTGRTKSFNFEFPVFAEATGEPREYRFYTLRVCKKCRGKWMKAIDSWFKEPVDDQDRY